MITSVDLVTPAFVAFSLPRLASCIPQIAAMTRAQSRTKAVFFSFWRVGANGSTGFCMSYHWVDGSLTHISVFNARCCARGLVLTISKRVGFACHHTLGDLPRTTHPV